jgi:DNA-binding MarR family transcriptional regulator
MSMETKILNYLKKHPEGIMILDLADAIGTHRHTVTKYVYRLEGMGRIKIRKIGIAKLCYLNKGVNK